MYEIIKLFNIIIKSFNNRIIGKTIVFNNCNITGKHLKFITKNNMYLTNCTITTEDNTTIEFEFQKNSIDGKINK